MVSASSPGTMTSAKKQRQAEIQLNRAAMGGCVEEVSRLLQAGVDLSAIRDYLAWEEVRTQLERGDLDPIREATLLANLDTARKRHNLSYLPKAIYL